MIKTSTAVFAAAGLAAAAFGLTAEPPHYTADTPSNHLETAKSQSRDIVVYTPGVSGLSWRNIVEPPLDLADQARVMAVAQACLKGPLAGRQPTLRTTYLPINHCSCIAAESLSAFTPQETAQLEGALFFGRRPSGRLEARWIALRQACLAVPLNRRLAPVRK